MGFPMASMELSKEQKERELARLPFLVDKDGRAIIAEESEARIVAAVVAAMSAAIREAEQAATERAAKIAEAYDPGDDYITDSDGEERPCSRPYDAKFLAAKIREGMS